MHERQAHCQSRMNQSRAKPIALLRTAGLPPTYIGFRILHAAISERTTHPCWCVQNRARQAGQFDRKRRANKNEIFSLAWVRLKVNSPKPTIGGK
jgi:hypothetical protein